MQLDLPHSPHGYRQFFCSACGTTFNAPIHCTSRTCDFCLSSRRHRIRRKISFALEHHKQTQFHRWRHVILTLRSREDLSSMIDDLIACFRKLRQRKLWKSTQSAAFYVIEVKRGRSGWHPHLHIISYGKYLPIRQLRANWQAVTTDSFYAYVRWIKQGTDIAWYVTKYITRSDPNDLSDQITIDDATIHRRLFGAVGDAGKLLRDHKYVDGEYLCPNCGCHCWIPEFLMQQYRRRAVELKPP